MRAKQNVPDSVLSRGTFADQPSPKCCSKTTLISPRIYANGPLVPDVARKSYEIKAVAPGFRTQCRSVATRTVRRSQNGFPLPPCAEWNGRDFSLSAPPDSVASLSPY